MTVQIFNSELNRIVVTMTYTDSTGGPQTRTSRTRVCVFDSELQLISETCM